ncbi:hypothetical protein GQ53DRAFT_824986 [Thozetella sp. PMI_491]|nr:hypothetical protein GQ53DRAFT_824986 [Thozetella sp. PMI_491]
MPNRTAPAPLRSGATGILQHDADFLKHIASREGQARAAIQPAPLTAKQHAKHHRTIEGVCFIKPKYTDETKGTSEEYIRQFQQLHTTVTSRYYNHNNIKELYKYHNRFLIPRFELRAPNINGKPVLNVNSLRVILVFNITYNPSIRPLKLQHINNIGCYIIICYTRVQPIELVYNKRKPPKDSSLQELFSKKIVIAVNDNTNTYPNDLDSTALYTLLLKETVRQDRVKALCYKDILMIVIRHPVIRRATLAISIKFIHHKRYNNKPKPYIDAYRLGRNTPDLVRDQIIRHNARFFTFQDTYLNQITKFNL